MTAWPPIDAPELRARLASDDAAFHQGLLDMARAIGPREFTEELYQHALGYPWPRPETSYQLDDGAVLEAAGDLGAEVAGRYPLLAFGSNGAPDRGPCCSAPARSRRPSGSGAQPRGGGSCSRRHSSGRRPAHRSGRRASGRGVGAGAPSGRAG